MGLQWDKNLVHRSQGIDRKNVPNDEGTIDDQIIVFSGIIGELVTKDDFSPHDPGQFQFRGRQVDVGSD